MLTPQREAGLTELGYVKGRGWVTVPGRGTSTSGSPSISCLHGVRYLGIKAFLLRVGQQGLSQEIGERQPRLVGAETVRGQQCYVTEYSVRPDRPNPDEQVSRAYACPALGWAPVREVTARLGGSHPQRVTVEYSGFRRFEDGVWLPTTFTSRTEWRSADGRWHDGGGMTARAIQLEVNTPISETDLTPAKH